MNARIFAFALVGATVALGAIGSAKADEWHDHNHDRREAHEPRWHGRDLDRWRRGHWWHGPHGNREGWWWIVGDAWYFYPRPVYPYPDLYTPPVVQAPSPPPGAPPVYYWCDNPRGYYPAVPACVTPWRAVPAAPPG
jgi:hypothetical protein